MIRPDSFQKSFNQSLKKSLKPVSMMVLTNLIFSGLLLGGLLCEAASGSEESYVPINKISIYGNAGKIYGKVSAVLETTGEQPNHRIKSIILNVHGRKIVIPQASFKNLKRPQIETARFLIGAAGGPYMVDKAGRRIGKPESDSPYLYLMFRLEDLTATSIDSYPKVYIRFRDGKLETTSIIKPNY